MIWQKINFFLFWTLISSFALAQGKAPLVAAASDGDLQKVETLLKKKNSVNQKDRKGMTALFYAVSNADSAMVQLLLKNKADLSILYGAQKENVLFEAARLGSLDIMLDLLKQNASLLKQRNIQEETALFAAVRAGQAQATELLIGQGADFRSANKEGKTLLNLAQEMKWDATTKVLQKHLKEASKN